MKTLRELGIALTTIILAVLLATSTAPVSAQTCGVEPVKPVPEVGCKDMTPSCVCDDSNRRCRWQWTCVRDTEATKKADDELAQALIGNPIMNARINRVAKKYCKAHPGEPFHWTMPDGKVVRRGTCPAKDHP